MKINATFEKKLVFTALILAFMLLEGGIVSHYVVEQEELRGKRESLHTAVLELQHQLGYVGLIHNFKNYLLRPDETTYKQQAIDNYRAAKAIVDQIELDAESLLGSVHLTNTRQMLEAYRQRIDTSGELIAQGLTVREIDEIVRFDDTPPHHEIVAVSARVVTALETQFTHSLYRSFSLGFIVFVALFVTLALTLRYFFQEQRKANNKIQLQAQRYNNIIENMPMGYHLWEFNEADKLIFTGNNEAANQILNFDHKAIHGKALEDAFPTLKDTDLAKQCRDIAKHGGFFEKETLNYKDNKIDSVFSSVYFQCYPGAMASIFRDISKIKADEIELKEAHQKLRAMAEGSNDGFWYWLDPQSDTLEWTDRFFEMLGHKAQAFSPSFERFLEFVHPDDRELVRNLLDSAIEKHELYEAEYRLQKADGEYHWYRGKGMPFYDNNGHFSGMAGSVADIHTTKLLEEKLLNSNQDLQRFAYICSHDLQEPLRTVSNFVGKLKEHLQETLIQDEKAAHYFNYVEDGAKHSQTMIRDILTFSRIDHSTEAMQLTDLNEVLASIKASLGANVKHGASSFALTSPTLPTVRGHRSQLYQLFQNLIGNAIKYQAPDNQPQISIHIEDKSDFWQFAIHDNGIGIQVKHYNKIFDIFKRLHHQNEYTGTGIGLAICKKIVDRHNGNIWVESEVGIGSTFYFTLRKTSEGAENEHKTG